MFKYFKWSILFVAVLIFGVCGYFLIAPKESAKEVALVPAVESFEYTIKK